MLEQSKCLSEQVEGVLRLVLDTLPVPILEFNKHLKICYANRAAQRLTGYGMGELQDGRFPLETLVIEEDRTRLIETMYRVLALEDVSRINVTLRHEDGKTVPTRFNVEVLFRRATVYGIRISLTEECGEAYPKEEKREQGNSMETTDRLAYNIVHDMKNMLQVIYGYADIALPGNPAEAVEDSKQTHYFSIIRDMALRCSNMANDLLMHGIPKVDVMQRTDINGIINELMKYMAYLAGRGIKLETDFNTIYSHVNCNPQKLEDALLNILYNAIDAMPQGGTLCISTNGRTLSLPRRSVYGFNVQPGQYLVISISDTGHGIDENIKPRIFDPFFTTKEKNRGTGLGLANVHETIKQHKGFIEITSAHNQGTLFDIYLPLADRETKDQPKHDTAVMDKQANLRSAL